MHMMDARVLDIQFDEGGQSNVEVTGLGKSVAFDSLWIVDTGDDKESKPSEWKLIHKESFGAKGATAAKKVAAADEPVATAADVAASVEANGNGASSASATVAAEKKMEEPVSPASPTNGNATAKSEAAPAAIPRTPTSNG